MCLYPIIASLTNNAKEYNVIKNDEKKIEGISEEIISKEKEAVRRYNYSLLNTHIVLTDPFDPDAFPVTDGKYDELLKLTDSMASIEIPAINVNLSIHHGTSKEVLANGVGHLENTSLPLGGESTHAVFSAHTGMPDKKLFSDLDRLKKNDIFYIRVLGEKLCYQIDRIKVVEPSEVSDLFIEKGKDYVTLITCTPYGKNTHRLLVRGVRVPEEKAEKVLKNQMKTQSFTQKMQMNYGISNRDILVFLLVVIFSIIFVLLIILNKKRKKRTAKHRA